MLQSAQTTTMQICQMPSFWVETSLYRSTQLTAGLGGLRAGWC